MASIGLTIQAQAARQTMKLARGHVEVRFTERAFRVAPLPAFVLELDSSGPQEAPSSNVLRTSCSGSRALPLRCRIPLTNIFKIFGAVDTFALPASRHLRTLVAWPEPSSRARDNW